MAVTHEAPPELLQISRDHLIYSFGAEHAPVATAQPGQRIRFETELNMGPRLTSVDQEFSLELVDPWPNPATGPVLIDGAKSGEHVVVCDVEEIEPLSPGATALIPGMTPFPDWIREREFGLQAQVVEISDGVVHWPGGRDIPIQPMIGVVGVAPGLGSVGNADNGMHGGNMDVQEIATGTRLLLPVAIDGALFALGDCHAVQGDGELCGMGGIECRTFTTVRVDLAPKPTEMRWPRIETDSHIGTIGCARPLEDAFRIAVRELVAWMAADFGFTEPEALMLLGQVAEARATQLINPKYTYLVKINRRWL